MHFSVSLLLMMIVLEYYPIKYFGKLLLVALMSQTMGKLVAVFVKASKVSLAQWSLMAVLPTCLIYVFAALVVAESPRHWIDRNISKAEKLLHDITQVITMLCCDTKTPNCADDKDTVL